MPKVTLIDKNDNIIGEMEKVKAHKNPVPLHRAISILAFNLNEEMLITKRAHDKFTWPGFWSNSVCTNVAPNETYLKSAKRRIKEELGVKGGNFKKLFNFTYNATYNKEFGENELDHVFKCVIKKELNPNPNEISDYKWVNTNWLKKDIKNNPNKYTPWFKIIMEKLNQF